MRFYIIQALSSLEKLKCLRTLGLHFNITNWLKLNSCYLFRKSHTHSSISSGFHFILSLTSTCVTHYINCQILLNIWVCDPDPYLPFVSTRRVLTDSGEAAHWKAASLFIFKCWVQLLCSFKTICSSYIQFIKIWYYKLAALRNSF